LPAHYFLCNSVHLVFFFFIAGGFY
jgi:hypothetical protein